MLVELCVIDLGAKEDPIEEQAQHQDLVVFVSLSTLIQLLFLFHKSNYSLIGFIVALLGQSHR